MSLATQPKRQRTASTRATPSKGDRAVRQNQPSGIKMDFDLLGIVRRRFPLVLGSAVVGAVLAVAYLMTAEAKFESRSKILLMRSDAASMASRGDTANELISQDMLATHMSLVQSSRIVDAALKADMLQELPSLVAAAGTLSTTEYVLRNLYVTRGGKASAKNSHTLNIAFHHTQPEDAQKVVEAVVRQYQEFVTTKFKDINKEAVGLITTARFDLEKQITELTEQYQEFRTDSPLISSEGVGGNVHEQRFQSFASQIAEVSMLIDETVGRLDLVKKGLEHFNEAERPAIEKLTLIDEKNAVRLGVLVTVERGEASSASFMALQPERAVGAQTEYSTLLQLRAKLKQAMRDFGANHPNVRDLQLQVSEMESFLEERQSILTIDDMRRELTPDDVMNAYVSLLESDLMALRQRKQDLEKRMVEAEAESKKLIGVELKNQEMVTKLNRTEALYDSVVTRLRDINMQQDATSLIQEEIESPRLGEKISPSLPMAAGIAVVSCLLLSSVFVLVAELSDKRLHSIDEVEEVYQTSVLGLIPDFNADARIRKVMKSVRRDKSGVAPSVISYHAGADPISETIRGIRTQLVFELGEDKRVIAITSPNQGDGKTTVSSNLAVSIAAAGKSVLIIDCDMRRPSLHSQFGVSLENGLCNLLSKSIELEDAIQVTEAPNLSLITAGGISDKPAELLSNEYFAQVLEVLRTKFDLVILDCPPIIPVSDPAILAPLADGVVLVTFLDSESGPKSKHCVRVLDGAGANLIGVIVNRANLKSDQYYQTYSGYYETYSANKPS